MRLHYAYSFDTPAFIEEVKKRRLLWDNSVIGYNTQKNTKLKLWDEICEVTDPEYRGKTFAERLHFRRLLQRRWKSLRDCFTRELGKMKRLYSVTKLAEYKPYCYFKNLGFLLDVVERDSSKSTKETNNQSAVVEEAVVEIDSALDDADQSFDESTVRSEISNNSEGSLNTGDSQLKMSVNCDEPVKQISAAKVLKVIHRPTVATSNVTPNVRITPSSVVKVLPLQMISDSSSENNTLVEFKGNNCLSETKPVPSSNIVMSSNDNIVQTSRVNISNLQHIEGSKMFRIVTVANNDANHFSPIVNSSVEASKLQKVKSLEISEFSNSSNRFNMKQRSLINKMKQRKASLKRARYRKLKRRMDDDDDRMFLLSLIKELKKVPEYCKMDVKLEIMQVLRNGQMKPKLKIDNFVDNALDYETSVIGANVTIHNQPQSPEAEFPENCDQLSVMS